MKEKELFLAFLKKEKEDCVTREQSLIKDQRKDEANICRIESNIYDIYATLYQSAIRETEKKNGNDDIMRDMFLASANRVPESWKKSLELAKEYNDTTKVLIEETKLKAVEKIMKEYKKQMEE